MSGRDASRLRVVLFSGGRGSRALLKELLARDVDLTIAINGYDDGASTGEVRRFLGDCLGPSDFRKNASRLARELDACPGSLTEAIDQRLPVCVSSADAIGVARDALAGQGEALDFLESFIAAFSSDDRPFDFGDCAIGNLVFAGAFLKSDRDFNTALDRFTALFGLRPGLIENVTDGSNAFLVGLTLEGEILASEHEIVDGTRRNCIDDIFLIDRAVSEEEERELRAAGPEPARRFFRERAATVRLNPRLADRIAEADVIVYGPGTQHSSLFPSYITPELGLAIARNVRAIKVLLTNLEADAEIAGGSAVDIITRALYYLGEKGALSLPKPSFITHYLINDADPAETARQLVLPGRVQELENARLVRIGDFEDGLTGRHDAAKALTPLMRSVRTRGGARRIAIVLHDARSPSLIAQSLLELVRGGLPELPIDVAVLHEGPALESAFTDLLPFPVQAVAGAEELTSLVEAGGFDYVVLFESSGTYRGEDVAAVAGHVLPGRLDAVWGSRRLSVREVEDSYRVRYGGSLMAGALSYLGSHILSLACLLLYGRYVSDTLSGVRAVRSTDFLSSNITAPGRGLNERLLARLLGRHGDVLEVPVRFVSQGPERNPSGRLAQGVHALLILFAARLRAFRESGASRVAADPAVTGRRLVDRLSFAAGAALVGSLALSLPVLGGWSAYAYALLVALAVLPGLPLGFALFGRWHPAGYVAGMLLGYAITAVGFWVVEYVHVPSRIAFVGVWTLMAFATWSLFRRWRAPAVRLPRWTRADSAAILLVLLLVPALITVPFAQIGAKDDGGNRSYRAYFTADFVWHTALTAELGRHQSPPRDPYLASAPLHYYWGYFLVPATLADETLIEVQDALKVNALAVGLLSIAAIFLAAWTWVPRRPFTVAAAVSLTVVAANAEGLAAIAGLLAFGLPLEDLRNLNIEAVAAWAFHGLRIDGLRRAMWYTPQHSMAAAVGLMALIAAAGAGARASRPAIRLAGLALGASVIFNPFVGVVMSAIYGLTILVDALRLRMPRLLLSQMAAALVVVAALGWCALNGVLGGVGSVLRVGWFAPARNAPLLTMLLSFGPILLPIAIAMLSGRLRRIGAAWPALAGMGLSLALMLFLSLSVDLFWVGFRAGHIFQVLAPAIVALGLIEIERLWRRRSAILVGVVVLAAGLPTTIIDTYNAQDVRNRSMGPGFHWTVVLTPPIQEALTWIRKNTPRDAVVQAEPTIRGRETWSLIPTFAERRMAAGLPISLMHLPEYDARSQAVHDIYASGDADGAWRSAKALGIDYLYADMTERQAYTGVAKFDKHPELFRVVFRNEAATVYAVR